MLLVGVDAIAVTEVPPELRHSFCWLLRVLAAVASLGIAFGGRRVPFPRFSPSPGAAWVRWLAHLGM